MSNTQNQTSDERFVEMTKLLIKGDKMKDMRNQGEMDCCKTCDTKEVCSVNPMDCVEWQIANHETIPSQPIHFPSRQDIRKNKFNQIGKFLIKLLPIYFVQAFIMFGPIFTVFMLIGVFSGIYLSVPSLMLIYLSCFLFCLVINTITYLTTNDIYNDLWR